MTILFMYDSPLRPEAGGTERATKLVMDELARRGHTTIGLLHFNQNNPDEYFLNEEQISSLIDFLNDHHVDIVVNQIAFHYWLLKEFLNHGGQEWRNEGGKIISFMHFDPPLRPLWYYGRFRNLNDLSFLRKLKRLGSIFCVPYFYYQYRKTRSFSYRYIYTNSDAYVLLSESFVDTFLKVGGLKNKSKIHIIPNMLTFPEIASDDILKKKKKTVLVVSRMDERQKRISRILKVWKQVKHNGYILKVVGSGVDLPNYKKWVEEKDCKDVEFCGQQSPLPYYQEAAVFLMTSMFEGWGLTLTESLQNGVVPVVLNTTSVFADIIDDGKTGYLANSKKEFVERLQLLLSDDEQREAMALAGLESAINFSAQSVGDVWNSVLDKL